jgi:hypothetical protein
MKDLVHILIVLGHWTISSHVSKFYNTFAKMWTSSSMIQPNIPEFGNLQVEGILFVTSVLLVCVVLSCICVGDDNWQYLLMWINFYVKVSIPVFWEGRILASSLVQLWVSRRPLCIMRKYRMMGLVSQVAVKPCTPTIFLTGSAHTVSWSVGITTSSF